MPLSHRRATDRRLALKADNVCQCRVLARRSLDWCVLQYSKDHWTNHRHQDH
ncbi:hypothetical protein THIOM_001291 [Candidatus Thiomargarita nelsonii]|uniref:Uncharacterized protein n=1 Tax=Candidatus Thiomargarita nelsonii TaxID=1003181 RepID=A0A176S4P1_9GAMM|nr:hypothetical protein THIOM_001291 [Candidatus Thiomargarita nelsonii]